MLFKTAILYNNVVTQSEYGTKMNKTAATLRDVAKHAGVSHQTVSRVIKGRGRVSDKTRNKVLASIAALRYRPHIAAQQAANGRADTLACFAPNLTNPSWAAIIESAQVEAREHGYQLLPVATADVDVFADMVAELVDGGRVDGVIVIAPYLDDRYQQLLLSVPVVYTAARPRNRLSLNPFDAVTLDDLNAGYQATRHLIANGHTQIGMITGLAAEDGTQDRIAGFRAAMKEAELPINNKWITAGNGLPKGGYDAGKQLLNGEKRPSALFVHSDLMAMGVLRAAAAQEIAVPDQLSVISIDDAPIAAWLTPPLTTLSHDFALIGRRAAELLVAAVENQNCPRQHITISATLIERKTVASIA